MRKTKKNSQFFHGLFFNNLTFVSKFPFNAIEANSRNDNILSPVTLAFVCLSSIQSHKSVNKSFLAVSTAEQ